MDRRLVGIPAKEEVIVLGWEPNDVHTTNFWEELNNG